MKQVQEYMDFTHQAFSATGRVFSVAFMTSTLEVLLSWNFW